MSRNAIAIVPARQGSKGLPGKNLRSFLGRPLVEWSILQALNAKNVGTVIVSSDDDRVLKIARELGAIAVTRPTYLASDSSPVGEALIHSLEESSLVEDDVTVVMLEPTSPLRPRGFIDESLEKYWTSGLDSAVSLGKTESQHPLFSVVLDGNSIVSRSDGGSLTYLRRQDVPDVYFLDGSFYATRLKHLRISGQMYSERTLGIPVEKWQQIEIDDIDDFRVAESLGRMYEQWL